MSSSRVVGLDIGTSALRAAEVEVSTGRRGGRPQATIVRWGEVPLPPGAVRDGEVAEPEVVGDAARRLWADARFGSKDVAIGVGNQRVIVRELELPWLPLAQLRESLPFQVQELLPMSASDALLDFFPTGESGGPQGRSVHGMLVAAQRDTVGANVRAVETAGLHPVLVDLNAFALSRALGRGELAQRIVAFVEIGASLTHIIVLAHGVPRLVRTLAAGGHDATQAVAERLGVSLPDAERVKRELGLGAPTSPEQVAASEVIGSATRGLVEAIRNTFVYYSGNHPGAVLEGVVLTGGGAFLVGLGQYLSSSSRLPVSIGNALHDVSFGKGVSAQQLAGRESLVSLPVGLALGVAA